MAKSSAGPRLDEEVNLRLSIISVGRPACSPGTQTAGRSVDELVLEEGYLETGRLRRTGQHTVRDRRAGPRRTRRTFSIVLVTWNNRLPDPVTQGIALKDAIGGLRRAWPFDGSSTRRFCGVKNALRNSRAETFAGGPGRQPLPKKKRHSLTSDVQLN